MNIWIFAYGSLLNNAVDLSLNLKNNFIPSLLNNYQKNWNSHRVVNQFEFSRKRFFSENFSSIKSFSYLSLEKNLNSIVPGVLFPVSINELSSLDFREQGYVRVNVSDSISFFDSNFSLDLNNNIIFTYIDSDNHFKSEQFNVNSEYINMCYQGAFNISKTYPDFLNYYIKSSVLPHGIIQKMFFLWIGEDGKTLWLLHEKFNISTCILIFPTALFESSLPKEATQQWNIIIPEELKQQDCRFSHVMNFDNPILDRINDLKNNPSDYINNNNSLLKLFLLSHCQSSNLISSMLNDNDIWVKTLALKLNNSLNHL